MPLEHLVSLVLLLDIPLYLPVWQQARLEFKTGQKRKLFFCSGGFLEVQPDLVTVLSDTAERADSLDESEAIKAKEAAEQELANKDATLDYAKASAQLAEAVARLKTIQKLRKNQ